MSINLEKQGIISRICVITKKMDGYYVKATKKSLLFPLTYDQFCTILLKRKMPIDIEKTKELFLASDENEVKICDLIEGINEKPILEIKITQDHMQAYIVLIPFCNGTKLAEEDIEHLLNKQKITFGIRREVIFTLLDRQYDYNECLIAEGTPCVQGTNAALTFNFNINGIEIKPQELSDGSVDFYNLNLIQTVEAGAVLVEKTPAQPGINGLTIYTEEIKAPPSKDIRLPNGQNTKIIDNTKLIAAKTGHVVYVNRKVNVLAAFEVRGDVDFNTGNIKFPGNVIVFGNVKSNFEIEASGDVEIHGSLEGTVKADGNLMVKKGIVRGKAYIKGNIYARYIENSIAESNTSIFVTEAIMHSVNKAAHKVHIGGKKGLLVGGSCCAGEEVRARNIGSNMGTLTTIEVGIRPDIRQEYKEAHQKLTVLSADYMKNSMLLKTLQEIKQKQGDLPENKKEILMKSIRLQYHLSQEIEELNERKIELEIMFSNMDKAKIIVEDKLYTGVSILMGKAAYNATDEMKRVIFKLDGYEIKHLPL